MSTSLRIRYAIDIGGQPYPFANPFTLQALQTSPMPAIFSLAIPVSTTVTAWTAPGLITTLDILAVQSDIDVNLEIVVGSDAQHFTLPVRGGGWPTIVPGGMFYAGQTGSQSAFTNGSLTAVSKVNVNNPSTLLAANVTLLIAQEA